MQGTVHQFIWNRTTSYEITFIPTMITHRIFKLYMDDIVFFFQHSG
jgi:peptidase E